MLESMPLINMPLTKRGKAFNGLAALSAVGVCAAIGLAAPAHAVPAPPVAGDDAGFLAALQQGGISYPDPGQAVAAGKAACTCLDNGESGLGLIQDLKTRNSGFDMDKASQFAVIAAKYYCPQQLSKR
jgi:hypothetical protein